MHPPDGRRHGTAPRVNRTKWPSRRRVPLYNNFAVWPDVVNFCQCSRKISKLIKAMISQWKPVIWIWPVYRKINEFGHLLQIPRVLIFLTGPKTKRSFSLLILTTCQPKQFKKRKMLPFYFSDTKCQMIQQVVSSTDLMNILSNENKRWQWCWWHRYVGDKLPTSVTYILVTIVAMNIDIVCLFKINKCYK